MLSYIEGCVLDFLCLVYYLAGGDVEQRAARGRSAIAGGAEGLDLADGQQ